MENTYKFKDKAAIIRLFNEMLDNYERYEDLLEGNNEKAQGFLNTAGNKLYQFYELGTKYHLNKRYEELYSNNMLDKSEYDKLVKTLEKGRNANAIYLSDQMDEYANPVKKNTDINFDLIKNNAGPINNKNKHVGKYVDKSLFEETLVEVRKFLLTYIDSNPAIQRARTSQYRNLQEACEYWKDDPKYNYCLICDRLGLDDISRRHILYIKWALIIDFDPETEIDGLLNSYINEYGMQPNHFDILNPKMTSFNPSSTSPYWFHINGVSDIEDSLADTPRKWNQKYSSCLLECFSRYRKTFSKSLKVVIVSGDDRKIDKILSYLDAVYEDTLKLYLTSDEVKYDAIKEIYSDILNYFPISEHEFSNGIKRYSSFFNRTFSNKGHFVCGRDGKVEIQLDNYSSFEIPYSGIEKTQIGDLEEDCKKFFQGKNAISWYGVQNSFAIDRTQNYNYLIKEIYKAREEATSKIVYLKHDPGAGGTTLSRVIAFDLSKTMPVLMLKLYNEKLTPSQTFNFYQEVGEAILIVVENSVISDEDLKKFNRELLANAVPHIFLRVVRLRGEQSDDSALRDLDDREFYDMMDKLKQYLSLKQREQVENLLYSPKDRYPFFMSMYAFEEDFHGVTDYIKNFFFNISEIDKKNLEYISLVDKFADKRVDISLLNIYDIKIGIFTNPVNDNLVTTETVGHNTFVKIRHSRFASEIIEQSISKGIDNSPLAKAEKLSLLLREFIKDSKKNIMYDFDSTIDVLKNLLILRDTGNEGYTKFAPVIEYIKEKLIPKNISDNEKYNCIGLIFKELVNVYSDEPHFRAHLSRFYSYLEKNYEQGMEEARKAVYFAEQRGDHDSLLYHIYGMSIKRYVEQKLYDEARNCKSFKDDYLLSVKMLEIQENLEIASEQFEEVRNTNNKAAGYISDIDMCISIVDFGKEIYDCSTEEFITEYKDSWIMEYYDRALTLHEGFRTIQVEEETEFAKVNIAAKSNDSLKDMMSNIEYTIELWQDYLSRATDNQKPVVRRFISRAKEKQYLSGTSKQAEIAKQVMQLMEENMAQEPDNGANIRIWFNALRSYNEEGMDHNLLLDKALEKLARWKEVGSNNLEAYYYYFILVCIKAIEGSSRAEAVIPHLEEELKTKTAHMANNRAIYEWLGQGKGVHRLINGYEERDGRYHKKAMDVIEKEASYLEGRISKYKYERSAQIRAYNMNVFFSPLRQSIRCTAKDIGKTVKFILGFSYDGLRALDRSIKFIDTFNDEMKEGGLIGKRVRCKVEGPTSDGYYLKFKLTDYRDTWGSIHRTNLPEDKRIDDYKYGDILYGKVIEKQYAKREKRVYYTVQLEEDDKKRGMDEWQLQLENLKEYFKAND